MSINRYLTENIWAINEDTKGFQHYYSWGKNKWIPAPATREVGQWTAHGLGMKEIQLGPPIWAETSNTRSPEHYQEPPPKHRVHTEHCWEWPSNNPPNHNKTTTRILFTSTSLAQIEKTGTIKWGQDVKSTDALYSSSNSAKWHNHTGNTLVVSYKLNIHLAYNSAFSFPPRNLLKRNENICSSQRPVQNALGRLIPNDLRRGKGRSKYSLLGEWFSLDHGLCASDKRIHCKTCRTKEVKDKSPECIVPLT